MIKGFVLALQFLTRIPLKIQVDLNGNNISKSTFFFPYIGMLIGAVSGAVYTLALFMGHDIAAFCGTAALIFITGGLHIDGLADTCDGFFSSRNSEKILEIMKDSRSGTFGVIAVVLDILIKFILLSKFQSNIIPFLMISCGNARLTAVMLMTFTKCARPGGMGSMFSQGCNKMYFYTGSAIYIMLIAYIFGLKYLIPLAAAGMVSLLVAWKSYKTIHGLTGDVYGANIELCEIAGIAAFLGVALWI